MTRPKILCKSNRISVTNRERQPMLTIKKLNRSILTHAGESGHQPAALWQYHRWLPSPRGDAMWTRGLGFFVEELVQARFKELGTMVS